MTAPRFEQEDALRKLAEKATSGKWFGMTCQQMPTSCCDYGVVALDHANIETARVWTFEDAGYIAAASPHVILSLLDALAALRAENARKDEEIGAARELLSDISGSNWTSDSHVRSWASKARQWAKRNPATSSPAQPEGQD